MAMCFVPGCKHYSEQRRCKFHRFPVGGRPRRLWIKLIRRENPSRSSYVCSCHFVDGNKKNYPTLFERGPLKSLRSSSPLEKAEREDSQVSKVDEPSTSEDLKCKVESDIPENGLIKTIKSEIVYEESSIKFEDFGYNSDLHYSVVIKTEDESQNVRRAQKDSTKELTGQINLMQPSSNEIIDKFKCGICNYATSGKSHFEKHLNIHAGLLSS